MLEDQNIKTFLQKATLQIGLKRFLWFKKVKKTVWWTFVIKYLNGEDIVRTFCEKSCKRQIKQSLELKK